jgi:DeoR/GlpR family transcriptional regulator of sugar metabolism
VSIATLQRELRVSEETVRRDLDQLATLGLVVRRRGGAMAPGSSLTEHAYQVRQAENRREKRAIARAVADRLVTPGISIALDAGSTSLEVARRLRGTRVTIVTHSLPVVMELLHSDCTVMVLGGLARGKSASVIGPMAERSAGEFHCDLAIISAPAITPDTGPMDTDLEEIEIKRSYIRQSARAFCVADHTKLGRTAFSTICRCADLRGLVTDDGAEPAQLAAFRDLGLEVVVGSRGDD